MKFKISDDTRKYAKEITGLSFNEIASMTVDERRSVNQGHFSPFRDSRAREIQPRGSVYLPLHFVARLKDISRRFFRL